MGEKTLGVRTWVSDKLMSVLGYSQPTVVQYVIGLAKQACSPDDVLAKLVEYGFPLSTETRDFADEIFCRVLPGGKQASSSLNNYREQEKEAALLVKKQRTYALLDADDDDDEDRGGGGGGDQGISLPKKLDSHQRSFRKKIIGTQDEDNHNEATTERRVRRRASYIEDELEKKEARLGDQTEHRQLERNMKETDAAGARKAQHLTQI